MAAPDPFHSQHQLYDAEYRAISAMLGEEDDAAPDWPALSRRVQAALSDPALPRWYRAEYHIIGAWHNPEPEVQIARAKETLADMVQVLQADGQTAEQIEERLEPLRSMLKSTEGALEEKKAKKAMEQKYAIPFRTNRGIVLANQAVEMKPRLLSPEQTILPRSEYAYASYLT